ncbi:MAG: MogA/MoaB family molybdenum cofactor biosynthesis protein [Pseudomonadota bacterium]
MKVLVLTVSDRAFIGEYEDKSGPVIKDIILEKYKEASVTNIVIPDEEEAILKLLENPKDFDFIITTGGTGLGPRDLTPELTEKVCDKALPGIAEALRYESYKETPNAMLSRSFAGLKNKTIIVNFPGSVKAAICCTKTLLPILEHGPRMIRGDGH